MIFRGLWKQENSGLSQRLSASKGKFWTIQWHVGTQLSGIMIMRRNFQHVGYSVFQHKMATFFYIDANKMFTFASNAFIMGENLLSHPTIRSICAWSVEIPVYLPNRFTWNFHRVVRTHVSEECISLHTRFSLPAQNKQCHTTSIQGRWKGTCFSVPMYELVNQALCCLNWNKQIVILRL
jgi:hypothetical protein